MDNIHKDMDKLDESNKWNFEKENRDMLGDFTAMQTRIDSTGGISPVSFSPFPERHIPCGGINFMRFPSSGSSNVGRNNGPDDNDDTDDNDDDDDDEMENYITRTGGDLF